VYTSDTPEQLLTRIRQEYYGGKVFSLTLIPNAANKEGPLGTPRLIESHHVKYETYRVLTAQADENAIQDNPSPYVVGTQGEQIDIGHTFLGLDALLHPGPNDPFKAMGIPNIDPASWIGDLGVAVTWIEKHQKNNTPASNAPAKAKTLTPPYLQGYWAMSCPDSDLVGDVDSFGLYQEWKAASGKKLSEVLRAYYLGVGGAPPRVKRRYQIFCDFADPLDTGKQFPYTVANGVVTWDTTAVSRWIARVNRMVDLIDGNVNWPVFGEIAAAINLMGPPYPPKTQWTSTPPILQKFLDWLKARLENELKTP
jgi:hypothetical protein